MFEKMSVSYEVVEFIDWRIATNSTYNNQLQ